VEAPHVPGQAGYQQRTGGRIGPMLAPVPGETLD